MMKLPALILFLLTSIGGTAQNYYLLIGTYTGTGSKGIYIYSFNPKTGTSNYISNTDSTVTNPSYLTVSPNGNFVYAVSETNGANPGKVSSFAFNKTKGTLKLINTELSGGDDPCYVATSPDGKWIIVANYTGGSVSAFPVKNDGSIEPFSQLIQDSGSSVNKERQEKAHVHESVFSPGDDFLFTPDLGADKVMIYKFDSHSQHPLSPATQSFVKSLPGSGPRHICFHPNKRFAYLIHELSGTVTAFSYNRGTLKEIQEIATHPSGYKGTIGSAEVVVSPDGKFLYASNRGDQNNLAIFSVNSLTGKLKSAGYQAIPGKAPRNFIMDPSGNYLLVANQNTDNVVIFERNKIDGMLNATGQQIHISKPVCLQMVKIHGR